MRKGSKHTAEALIKIGLSGKGRPAWNKGRIGIQHHSKKSRQKMSMTRTGVRFSESHKLALATSKIREKNPAWKGGRVIDSRGYVLVKISEHPNCNCRGYVREHRVVLELFLKRYLLNTETPHHINGIKDDNRLENLILFKTDNAHLSFEKHGKKRMDDIVFDGRKYEKNNTNR
jgi:hypothetical protein